MNVHQRAYRVLLRAYPAEHRREYGEPMSQMFNDRIRDDGGGLRTAVVWMHVLVDLAKTVLAERTETTMDTLRTGWWRIAAGLIATVLAIGGIGIVVEPGPGPWYKTVSGATALFGGVVLIVVGLAIRRRNTNAGSALIAVGVVPGVAATVLFWFPPALVFGLISTSVLIAAVVDVGNHLAAQRAPAETAS